MVRSHEPCSLQVQQDQLNTTMYNSLQWAALIYSRKDFFQSPFFSLQGLPVSRHFLYLFKGIMLINDVRSRNQYISVQLG